MTHESVLLAEAVTWLDPGPGKILVDGTLGRGGHAMRWLESSSPDGQVVGFDRDPQAVLEAGRILSRYGDRAVIVHDNFLNCANHLAERKIGAVDAVLLDLGVSSPQLDEADRGFSFRMEGPLDMRMDPTEGMNAAEVVNEASEATLRDILWKYGQERFSRQIARRVVEARDNKKIMSTKDLENIIFHAVPKASRFGKIHPATRTFQALRIYVNREIESLTEFLPQAPSLLKTGGRLAVISFHSLEDRAVKTAFRELNAKKIMKTLTKKPVIASDAELVRNPRSRSAKMRVAEKRATEEGLA